MSDAATGALSSPNISQNTGRSKRPLWFVGAVAAAVIIASFTGAFQQLSNDHESMRKDMEQRQSNLAEVRAGSSDAWIQYVVEQTKRLVSSELFQLFVSEVDKLPDGIPMLFAPPSPYDGDDEAETERTVAGRLAAQLPLMRTLLTEFTTYTSLQQAYIVNSKGEPYISTQPAMAALSTVQKALVAQVVQTGEIVYGPLEVRTEGIAFDFFVPIMPPQYEKQSNKPVAVIIATQVMDQKIAETLAPGPNAAAGWHYRLIQKNGDIYQNVVPGMKTLREVAGFTPDAGGDLPFELRRGFSSGDGEVYSSGRHLRYPSWWVVVEADASLISSAMKERSKTMYGLAALISVMVVLLLSTVWWRLVGREQREVNARFRDLVAVIDEQKKLLDGINSTMSDPISYSDSKGVYKYVNAAFAKSVGRYADDIVGLDGPAVFGFDTARRLNLADQHALMTGESVTVNEILWLQSKRYFFQISKTPLKDPTTKQTQGIVSVYRDITLLVETEERSRRVVQQTIDALVRAIEEADPFLGGHSRIMGGIAVLLAKQLRLAEGDVATIDAAANLSQVGKMFVPRETLMDGDKLLDLLHHYNIHFIVLAGYLLLVPSVVSREYNDRIVNIHPSLLPKYGGKGMYGMKVHEAVLQNKEAESGITIHYINEEFDKGEIIFQATTPIYADDTPDAIAERIHKLEHKYYPQVIEHTIINSEGSFD